MYVAEMYEIFDIFNGMDNLIILMDNNNENDDKHYMNNMRMQQKLLSSYDINWITELNDDTNNSTIICDPYKFEYIDKLLNELEKYKSVLMKNKTTTMDIDKYENKLEDKIIIIKDKLHCESLHEYIRIKINSSKLYVRQFIHNIYGRHLFIPNKLNSLKEASFFSSVQYSDVFVSFFWEFVTKFGKYINSTDLFLQIYDDMKYQHNYNWLTDEIPILLSDSNAINTTCPNNILLHSVSRSLAMINQNILPFKRKHYIKIQELKTNNTFSKYFDWRNKPYNVAFFRGANQGLFRWKYKELYFWETMIDFKYVTSRGDTKTDKLYYVNIEEHLKYKFIINIDGYSVRDSFTYNLQFGVVIFSLNNTGNREFWYDNLKNEIHYILFNNITHLINLVKYYTNIVHQYEINKNHSEFVVNQYMKLYQISENAKEFARKYLNKHCVYCFMIHILQIYNKYFYDSNSLKINKTKDKLVDLTEIVKDRENEEKLKTYQVIKPKTNKENKEIKNGVVKDEKIGYTANRKQLRLVLTYSIKEPMFDRLYVFIASFYDYVILENNSIYQYKMIIFTDFNDTQFMEKLQILIKSFNFITLMDINILHKTMKERYSKQLNDDEWLNSIDMLNRRFFEYYEYLKFYLNKTMLNNIDGIFISDANDVLFQGNIFNLLNQVRSNSSSLIYDQTKTIMSEYNNNNNDEYFIFFMEQYKYHIFDNKPNMNWIQQCFGHDIMLNEFGNKSISCAGTMLATLNGMIYYLLTMISTIIERHILNMIKLGWDQCLSLPSDQGLHNVILHRNLLKKEYNINTIIIQNKYYWIMQITLMTQKYNKFNNFNDEQILNFANKSCVLHQWKRHKIIENMVLNAYNYTHFLQTKFSLTSE